MMIFKNTEKYPDDWDRISVYVKNKLSHRRCSYCWINESEETHHSLYRICYFIKPKKWASGVFLFPLCKRCHSIAHQKNNWRRYNNEIYNKNSFIFWLKLFIRYRLVKIFT